MKKTLNSLTYLSLAVAFAHCSSQEPARPRPEWVSSPTRVVDNGYIVYIGSGEEVDANNAELAAEGMALQDLANECSFVPKGTRVEDRFSEKQKNTYKAYAKIAVDFETCSDSAKINDPAQIKLAASLPFTEQLKNFEDSIQNNRDEVVESGLPADQIASGPQNGSSGISSNVHFFMARQYVVYQNQVVIMSPPAAYAPGSPEYQTYANSVRPVAAHVQTYAAANPQIRANPGTWSSMSQQVRAERPQSFAQPHGAGAHQMHAPTNPRNENRANQNHQTQKRRRRR